MALRISSNIPSITAQRYFSKAEDRAEHSLQALASGSRIVRAGDDAAGLAISENLRAQLSGIKQAESNASNATSLVQVAEGALNEQTNILIRLRELGIQSASDTVSDVEREYLEVEFNSLLAEFDRIAHATRFGNRQLLVGGNEIYEIHVGPSATEENIIRYQLDDDSRADAIGISGLSIVDQDSARDTLESIDEGLSRIGTIRAKYGAFQSRFQSATNNLGVQYENVSAARARLYDVDVAEESAELASAKVNQDAALSVLAQANTFPARAVRLISQI